MSASPNEGFVEYVVRQYGAKRFSVYMIELAADGKTFLNSHFVSDHRSVGAADNAAARLRKRDEAHISRKAA